MLALPGAIVGFIAKVAVQVCPKLSPTVWSEYTYDGMLTSGHTLFRSGQAWNDWEIIEWVAFVGCWQ